MSCTTIPNSSIISSPISLCTGSYGNITVDAKITIEAGQTVALSGPIWGPNAEIDIQGGVLLQIGGGDPTVILSKPVNVTNGGIFHLSKNLLANSGCAISVNNGGQLVTTADIEANDAFYLGNDAILYVTNSIFNADFIMDNAGSDTAITAKTLSFTGDTTLTRKIEVSGTTLFANAATNISCCMLKTGRLINSAAANAMTGAAYIEVNGLFLGANALTADSTIELYKGGGGGNVGSATVLTSKKSPSPC